MKHYYRQRPQLNREKAFNAFKIAQQNISSGMVGGHVYEDMENVYEYKIFGTAFSIIYTQRGEIIYVLDIRDQRGLRSATMLEAFNRRLRDRYGL
ncbi:MAG: hypothetical protein JKX71_01740 [Amylibacter sp.]|nr:hypothetical protein [Amylibacter sp.]